MDRLARRLLDWYRSHGRHDLPWQHPRTPYRVWISEVMLQQTRVATVIPYFERFTAALPDVPALAAASEDQVLALWSGLGYYRRARNLQAAARFCVEHHGGALPGEFAAVAALPGIGRSTAGAIMALGHGRPFPILDGNARRVLARYHAVHGWPGAPAVAGVLWEHAEAHTPSVQVADYTQAIMDLGASVCTRTRPACDACPLAADCAARRAGLVDAIPAARPARTLPEKHTLLVVVRDTGGRVWLRRRPAEGVWPGLWSLPEASDRAAARTLAAGAARLAGTRAAALPEIRHDFTHYRLLATPLAWFGARPKPAVADAPDQRWCDDREIARLGIPAPVRRLLESLAAEGRVASRRATVRQGP